MKKQINNVHLKKKFQVYTTIDVFSFHVHCFWPLISGIVIVSTSFMNDLLSIVLTFLLLLREYGLALQKFNKMKLFSYSAAILKFSHRVHSSYLSIIKVYWEENCHVTQFLSKKYSKNGWLHFSRWTSSILSKCYTIGVLRNGIF